MMLMAQHFLLSAQARTLSLRRIIEMPDKEAFDLFLQCRWGDGDPVCPSCGCIGKHYFITTRQQWRCKDCTHTFSITSGTIFANHKLPLKVYLAAIAIYSNAVKGISALQLARDLNVQYKTAFVLAHKIRESLIEQRDESELDGDVEMDGAYVNGHVRPANKKADRVDRRLTENQNPAKRCVFVMRLRDRSGHGAKRTLTFVMKQENQADVKRLAGRFITKGTVIYADEASAYDALHAHYDTRRVNHQVEYCSDTGANSNQAESFFSRFRRMQYGQVHKFGNQYLDNYANEAAYREDNRRMSNGVMFLDIMDKCVGTRVSRDFCGYWQGNKRHAERLVA
jgi:transposase-like protein